MNKLSTSRALRSAIALGVAALSLQFGVAGAAHAQAAIASLHDFDRDADGGVPQAGLILSADGYFYGTTQQGGANFEGTVYRVKPDGSGFQNLHSFDDETEGQGYAGVIEGKDGALYGTTFYGDSNGTASAGSIFRLTKDGQYTTLHVMNPNGSEGGIQYAGLVQDADGVLYGAGGSGGTSGVGSLFAINPDGSNFHVLHQFAGGVDGENPLGTLIIGADGRLYGTVVNGGAFFKGGIFSLARDGSGYKMLHALAPVHGDGTSPQSGLMDGKDGWLYGTTTYGGFYCDCGTVYRVNPAGQYETLRSFDPMVSGAIPLAPPTFGPNGHLYGTVSTDGGQSQFQGGGMYEIDLKGKLVGILPMPYPAFYAPTAALLLGPDKHFYTTVNYSIPGDYGSVVSFDPAAGFQAPVVPPVWEYLGLSNAKIRLGQETVISWNSQNAGKCVASDAWSGHRRANALASRKIVPTKVGQYTYTLTCNNSVGSTTQSAVLTVLKAADK